MVSVMWSPGETSRCPNTFPTSWSTGSPSTQLKVVPTTTLACRPLKATTTRAYDEPDEHDTLGSVQPAVRECNDRPDTIYPASCLLLADASAAASVSAAADPQPHAV